MPSVEAANLATVQAYLQALEAGAVGETLAKFFTPDARQVELPNRLNPSGGASDLPTLLQRAEQGQKLLHSQRYEVKSEVAQGHRVAVEATWHGILAVPLGSLAAGATLKAHFAMFFQLSEGRIREQRNYDCFEPW
ncbi:MAG TPA: nuclear transport factor 2 family protein [Burkholderiales bacterium]|nr:nuclear transport factor 2 family protein [Burkholderiales bacterium]